ncbi:MAG: 2-dehydropantoate 2-reductase [Planctomycetota bacterium]|nr:MAG: 2-dehydropantoate 2-reductase [Planctomycetota bacterium]
MSLAAMLGRTAEVTIVVRNPTKAERITSAGVAVHGLMQAMAHPTVVPSIAALAETMPLTAIFVATKTTAIDQVARELGPVLDSIPVEEHPFVISFQNGIEPGRDLGERLHEPRILRMVLNYGATSVDDNAAVVMLNMPPHYIGGPDATHRKFVSTLAALLTACGLPTKPVENIEPVVWAKGVLNAAMNPVAALTDSSVGEVLDSPAREIVSRLIDEGLSVARADGIKLGPDMAAHMWAILDNARPHTPSMVGDIRGGRPSEVGQLNRQIIEHARRTGVPSPSHEVVAALIDSFDWRVFRSQQPVAETPA